MILWGWEMPTKDGDKKGKSKEDDQHISLQTAASSSSYSILIALKSLVARHQLSWQKRLRDFHVWDFYFPLKLKLIGKTKSHVASQCWPQFLIMSPPDQMFHA